MKVSTQSREQSDLFDTEDRRRGDESTFGGNMTLAVHRWYRYSAGFSAVWAEKEIRRQRAQGRKSILDPFAGSGTTLIAAQAQGLSSVGIEAHPFVSRIAAAKLKWPSDIEQFREMSLQVLDRARCAPASLNHKYPPLIDSCYPADSLQQLDALRTAYEVVSDESPSSELTWLTLASILRECSPVGTAQWQYVLPNKSKAKWKEPYAAFAEKARIIAKDMAALQRRPGEIPVAQVLSADARTLTDIPDASIDFVLTSPPYANNYDYADATRLEMSFFNLVTGWKDLQSTVRSQLVRSCTQHVASLNGEIEGYIADPILAPIRTELQDRYVKLDQAKELHGGKKPYHKMAVAYFHDLAEVWTALRRVCGLGSAVCFVVGDSAPYSIHLPVEKWLGELALGAGFSSFTFEQTRLRNVKWKNRKHTVPLHEGLLWVNG